MDSGKEIKPLKTLEEILSWKPSEQACSHPLSMKRSEYYLPGGDLPIDGAWKSLVKTPLTKKPRVKTLVCHDMMGGYLQDRFLNGVEEDGYHFRHWSNIDIFVYFSHHFLTIPPPGWISAARVHGVQVLGTIITEWDEGQKMLETVLQDDEKVKKFVDVCVKLCRQYGFHGWLFNIENKVDKEHIPKLVNLVKSLSKAIKQELGEDEGMVLWYDSVTIEGDLRWQNELNSLNKPFFDVCDGIFLNYTWTCGAKDGDGNVTPDSLANSVSSLLTNGTPDTVRHPSAVYVGVDVFGRGCLGGGGFKCNQALNEIRKRGMSVAIFAPGWTYEIPHRDREKCGDIQVGRQFLARQHTFWGLLRPFLNVHGPNLARVSHSEPRDDSLVFRTGFSLGRRPAPQPAYNLTRTHHQPSLVVFNEGENNEPSVLADLQGATLQQPKYSCYTCDDFSLADGQSLKITSKDSNQTIPIFIMELPINSEKSFLFVLTVKTENKSGFVQLKFGTDDCQEMVTKSLSSSELAMMAKENNLDIAEASSQDGWRIMAFILMANGRDHKTIHKIGLEIENPAILFIGKFEIYKISS